MKLSSRMPVARRTLVGGAAAALLLSACGDGPPKGSATIGLTGQGDGARKLRIRKVSGDPSEITGITGMSLIGQDLALVSGKRSGSASHGVVRVSSGKLLWSAPDNASSSPQPLSCKGSDLLMTWDTASGARQVDSFQPVDRSGAALADAVTGQFVSVSQRALVAWVDGSYQLFSLEPP